MFPRLLQLWGLTGLVACGGPPGGDGAGGGTDGGTEDGGTEDGGAGDGGAEDGGAGDGGAEDGGAGDGGEPDTFFEVGDGTALPIWVDEDSFILGWLTDGGLHVVEDVTGDGVDDLFVDAWQASGAYLYCTVGLVVPGPLEGEVVVDAGEHSAVAGCEVATGDVDGDGYTDMVTTWNDPTPHSDRDGSMRAHRGPAVPGATATSDWFLLPHPSPGRALPVRLPMVEDFDGDGQDDVLSFAGTTVGLQLGPVSADATEVDRVLSFDLAADAVTGDDVGDIDGDGVRDVVLRANGGSSPAWLFTDIAAGDATADDADLLLDADIDAVTGLGDVTGDGHADLALVSPDREAIYVVVDAASASTLTFDDAAITVSPSGHAVLRGASSNVGDWSGDGVDDLAVSSIDGTGVNMPQGGRVSIFVATEPGALALDDAMRSVTAELQQGYLGTTLDPAGGLLATPGPGFVAGFGYFDAGRVGDDTLMGALFTP